MHRKGKVSVVRQQLVGDSWTPGAVVAAAFFVLFLLVQTLIPLVQLAAPRPARFGWQMYSAKRQRPQFSLILRDGSSRPLDLGRYVAQSRGEVDVETALPPHLCRVIPDLAAVRITAPNAKQPRVYACP